MAELCDEVWDTQWRRRRPFDARSEVSSSGGRRCAKHRTLGSIWIQRRISNLEWSSRQQQHLLPFQSQHTATNMSQQALNKIAPNSPSRAKPSEIETQVANALYELETHTADMRSALRPLQFVSAREVR